MTAGAWAMLGTVFAAGIACSAERSDVAPDSADTHGVAHAESAAGAAVPEARDTAPRESVRVSPADRAGGPARRDGAPPARERTPQPSPPSPARESLRGVVRVVGSEPVTDVVLRFDGAERRLTGSLTTALRRVSGTEVSVSGTAGERNALEVREFTVRAVDGEPAIDGIIAVEGGDVVIVTAAERVRLGNPPSELRALAGARVWITGPPATGPHVYGVIER